MVGSRRNQPDPENVQGKKRQCSDYEKFIKTPGRDDLIKQVRKKIDALGIEYLYLQFVSITGRIMGKGIPADHWENVANGGFQLVYGATVNLFMNRRGEYLGYGPEAAELVGVPEPETFMQLPWDKRVARMFCTLFRNREERENPGAFLTSDCRGNLAPDPRPVREGSRTAHAARHRAGDDVAQEERQRRSGRRLFAIPIAITSTSSKACARFICGSSSMAARWVST